MYKAIVELRNQTLTLYFAHFPRFLNYDVPEPFVALVSVGPSDPSLYVNASELLHILVEPSGEAVGE